MKRVFFIFFLLIFVFFIRGFAQGPIDDCFNYVKAQDYRRAIEAGKRAVSLFPRSVEAHLCLGYAYRMIGEFNLALESFKKAEVYATSKKDLMEIYNQVGMTYYGKGDLDNALFYLQKALFLAKDLGDVESEASHLNNIAVIYEKKGDLDKALSYYEESLKLNTREDEKAPVYNNIAVVYVKKGEYTKAIDYLKKALEINERYGNYHAAGIHMLNIGEIYRRAKDFDKAYYYLQEGLKRVQKVGDNYGEATAYKCLGWYYRDLGDKKLAKDYLTKAYNLFKSIGAEFDALEALLSLYELEKVKVSKYAGIEIGSKGVKASAFEMTTGEEGLYETRELFKETINTTIIAGVKETGKFSPESIEETARAAKVLYDKIRNLGIPENNVFLVASSAISSVSNRDELASKVKELTGKELQFLSKDDEVLYNIAGTLPERYYYNSIVIDIGSGNTKIGYLEKVGNNPLVRSFEIPYGTVTLTEEAKKRGDLKKGLREVINKEVLPVVRRQIEKNPAYRNRKNAFLMGGIVWSFITLEKPESVNKNLVEFREESLERFSLRLTREGEKIFNPNLSRLKPELRERAEKEILKVKDVFTYDNLVAGTELLKALAKEFNFKGKNLLFPRHGSWLTGYVILNGYWIEQEKEEVKEKAMK